MEAGGAFLENEFDDEDISVVVTGKESRWQKRHYVDARRSISSLGAYVSAYPHSGEAWDGGAVSDKRTDYLGSEWITLYDRMTSHAVISAFNMLAGIFEQAQAVDETKNRPFVVSHATPAALAILLHDWRIWKDARKWKLFPVNSAILPMAALLIFIDTWDDFKRKGPSSPVNVDSFDIHRSGASVKITWRSAETFEREKVKYQAYRTALRNRAFRMTIKAGAASVR